MELLGLLLSALVDAIGRYFYYFFSARLLRLRIDSPSSSHSPRPPRPARREGQSTQQLLYELLLARSHGSVKEEEDEGEKEAAAAALEERSSSTTSLAPPLLLKACMSGDVGRVQSLLWKKADPWGDMRDDHARTALMLSCEMGHVQVAALLLELLSSEERADRFQALSECDDIGRTALSIALDRRDSRLFGLLLDSGAPLEQRSPEGLTPLMQASIDGNLVGACHLLAAGLSTSTPVAASRDSARHRTPLILACEHGHADIVEALLDADAGLLEARDASGRTALICAVEARNVEVVRLLCNRGAAVEARGADRLTPLLVACGSGFVDVAAALLDHGADIEAREDRGVTALMLCAWKGLTEVVRLLCDRGARLEAVDTHGESALHFAAYYDRLETSLLLASRGASPDSLDNERRSAASAYGLFRCKCTAEEKSERVALLHAEFFWFRRKHLMMALAGSGLRPLLARRRLLEERAQRDTAAPLAPVLLDTPEQRHAHVLGLALSNDGLVRKVASFL